MSSDNDNNNYYKTFDTSVSHPAAEGIQFIGCSRNSEEDSFTKTETIPTCPAGCQIFMKLLESGTNTMYICSQCGTTLPIETIKEEQEEATITRTQRIQKINPLSSNDMFNKTQTNSITHSASTNPPTTIKKTRLVTQTGNTTNSLSGSNLSRSNNKGTLRSMRSPHDAVKRKQNQQHGLFDDHSRTSIKEK